MPGRVPDPDPQLGRRLRDALSGPHAEASSPQGTSEHDGREPDVTAPEVPLGEHGPNAGEVATTPADAPFDREGRSSAGSPATRPGTDDVRWEDLWAD